MSVEQLVLPISLEDAATFENFHAGVNRPALKSLQQWLAGGGDEFCCYLFGGEGVGRTHLMQAACRRLSERGQRVAYLPLADVFLCSPVMLDNLEQLDWVCIDDIDAVLGEPAWEEALFHFYNRARDAGSRLMVTASLPAAQLKMGLMDLRSRLAQALSWELKPLTDDEKIAALQHRAHQRGFDLSFEVGRYLLHHYPRTMRDLFAVLDRLDAASLAAQRRITIPFLKTLL